MYHVLIFISNLLLDSTYPVHLSIKGDLKTVQITELIQFQDLEGFYIREVYLTNGRPSWHHERLSWLALWFDYESGNWMVGDYKRKNGLLISSTSPDNRIPEQVNTWEANNEANVDLLNDKLSDISIKAGTIKLQAVDRSTIQYLTIWHHFEN